MTSGKLTLGELIRLRHNLLTAPAELGGSGLRSAIGKVRPDQQVSFHDESELAIGSLDPDGDGKDAILTNTYGAGCFVCPEWLFEPQPGTLTLREGETGQPIWTVESNNLAYLATADLTGDGVEEVIALEEEWIGAGAIVVGAYALQSRVRVLDATNGDELWRTTKNGSIRYAGAGFIAGAYVYGVSNLVYEIASSDADAGPARTLFVSTLDFDLAAAFALAFAEAVAIRIVGDTYAGADGSVIGSASSTGSWAIGCALLCVGSWGVPGVRPLGDVDGDGVSDLVTAEAHGPALLIRARTVDGETTHWSRIVPSLDGSLFPLQLNGTGPTDLLVFDGLLSQTIALDGATGEAMWESDQDLYWAYPAGDIDGDGGTDLLIEDWFYDYETGESGLRYVATAGSSGDVIYEAKPDPTLSVEADEEYFWPSALDDLDGDGAHDLLFERYFYKYEECVPEDEEEWCDDWTLVGAGSFAMGGKDGSIIWEQPIQASYRDLLWPSGSDADDDGGIDLVNFDEQPGSLVAKLSSGRTLDAIWQASSPTEGNEIYVDYLFGADVDANEGDELVVTVWDELWDEETFEYILYGYASRVIGSTGELWRT